ncbi:MULTISPECIES: cell wall metabolism sensor histidine kinase WalK [Synechococcaceae]|uniref:sensor histidine kinase n=1 Tax=Synechococcaceae TaxID=1890426 RepID=UPI0008FF0660|nr:MULTISPECIES: HAMP domain-containing sensor histidine kinase [Synechococcaceae]MCT4363529.1 HAMP domain-containing histidine kinase [Candidatus Regnicoccus frigidus MAG-AL1]APD48226.1 PAS domain-containing sensor histidine kinase [Synechococcus sp. SynAce01]MCT0246699.1 HAMP domain-containing histidine kinase [Synechococcus sp. CS-601]MCT4366131.1 HAMP domain-containing histidine kinase [Candidatus Regnicoccus frigidus MAG-AL2]TWB93917.1 two-component system phosphate regulon sensor histidi
MTAVIAAGLGLLLGLGFGLRIGFARGRHRAGVARPGTDLMLRRGQLQRWLEAAPLGWLLLDDDLQVHSINAKAERLLNIPTGQLVRGQPFRELVQSSDLEEAVHSVLRHQLPERREWSLGEDPIEVTLLPGGDGSVALWLNSRRSLESQLDQQGRWVSDVAHELKTPLTSLLLLGDSLAAQSKGPNRQLIERLQRELQRLQSLVGDLLELSQLENSLPRDERRYEVLDLAELVQEVWTTLRPLAEQRGVQLSFPEPPSSLLWGDSSRLHRALLNLLDNAVRYSPDHGVVEVRLLGANQWWELEIRDHGCGFNDDDLERMFERFYRGDPSRVRSHRAGSGLGLAIVQQIAITHAGRVRGRNHPGGGAVMELVLPKGI